MENNKDVRRLVKEVQGDLPELSTSSLLSDTSILSVPSESEVLKKYASIVGSLLRGDV